MPNPNLKRDLPPGKGGKRDGAGRIAKDDPGRKFALRLLSRPKFLAAVQTKMDDCTLHPSVMTAVMYYGWGKPRETVEVKQVVPVRIVHEYTKDPDKKDDPAAS